MPTCCARVTPRRCWATGYSPLRRWARSCVRSAGATPANSTRWPASCWGGPGPPGPVRARRRPRSMSTRPSVRPTGWPSKAACSATPRCGAITSLVAAVAGTSEVVHSRLRGGNAHSGRGAASFLTETFNRVRAAGATGSLTLRADSGFYNHKVVDACRAADVRYSITAKLYQGLKSVIEAIDESAWAPIAYFFDGADVAESTYEPFGTKGQPCRLIVRRVRPTPGSQLALFTEFSYHAFITDRAGATLELEADHRRHAEIENVIRDLKYGVGLNHLPSGRFGANAAWLGLNVIAHNLARFSTRLGLDGEAITTETFRRRYLSLPGRLTRSARRVTLHLPARWPWAERFLAALTCHRNVLLVT